MSLLRRNETLGRSDVVEGRPQTGEVPDLAPPPSATIPGRHTRCPVVSNLSSVTNARERARELPSCRP